MDPPTYSQQTEPCGGLLLNVCPLPNESSYLLGTLGFGHGTVEGEVQIKQQHDSEGSFNKLEVTLVGIESCQGGDSVLILEQSRTLWDANLAQASTQAGPSSVKIPTSSTFSFNLTSDLPNCIHRVDSALEYSLTATLSGPQGSPVSRSTPIHILRNSDPAAQTSYPTPPPLSVTQPVKARVQLAKTTFRKSEIVGLVVQIDVPSSKAVEHDSLRLRTVSAELVRQITVAGEEAERPTLLSHASSTSRGKESAERDWGDSLAEGSSSQLPPPLDSPPLADATGGPSHPGPVHETILSRSGKSCRFSPSRPVILKLLLHPPALASCDSITQATILHQISFVVKVTIGLLSSSDGTRQDLTLMQEVTIIPDFPAPSAGLTDKQREAGSTSGAEEDRPVPTYHEAEEGLALPTSSTFYAGDMHPPPGWEQEEFDGYEAVSLEAASIPPPPAIEEDVSPPSVTDAHTSSGITPIGSADSLVGLVQRSDESHPSSAEASPALRPLALSLVLPSSDSLSLSAHPSRTVDNDAPSPGSPPPDDGLPPPYAGAPSPLSSVGPGVNRPGPGVPPPSYSSSQPVQLVGVTDQGVLVGLQH